MTAKTAHKIERDFHIWLSMRRRCVRALQPDMKGLAALAPRNVILTAPGSEVDFVSRYFAPSRGVHEDSVTGSAHCTLIPY